MLGDCGSVEVKKPRAEKSMSMSISEEALNDEWWLAGVAKSKSVELPLK